MRMQRQRTDGHEQVYKRTDGAMMGRLAESRDMLAIRRKKNPGAIVFLLEPLSQGETPTKTKKDKERWWEMPIGISVAACCNSDQGGH